MTKSSKTYRSSWGLAYPIISILLVRRKILLYSFISWRDVLNEILFIKRSSRWTSSFRKERLRTTYFEWQHVLLVSVSICMVLIKQTFDSLPFLSRIHEIYRTGKRTIQPLLFKYIQICNLGSACGYDSLVFPLFISLKLALSKLKFKTRNFLTKANKRVKNEEVDNSWTEKKKKCLQFRARLYRFSGDGTLPKTEMKWCLLWSH